MARPRREETERPIQPAIYIRVSTDKQAKSGLGLEDQRIKTQAEALAIFGFNVSEEFIFVDNGISGKKNENKRPSFARMMQLVRDQKISHVIVNDLSRLGRSVQLISNAIVELDNCGCAFISVKERFNTGNAMGKAMLNMVATFAQLESDLASERTTEALAVRKSKFGIGGGQVIYGYHRASNTSEKKSDEVITINVEEAKIIKDIFYWRNERASMQDIADDLNDMGIISPRGSKWYPMTIKIILDNEHIYKGQVKHYPKIID